MYYFTYKHIQNDTIKFQIDTVLAGMSKNMAFPFKSTSYSCFIRNRNHVFLVDKLFSKEFEKIPNEVMDISSGINFSNNSKCILSSIFSVINTDNKVMHNSNDSTYTKILEIPNLPSTKISNTRIKYSLNKEIYFIIDSSINPSINPGVFASYINGGVIEIKTIHNHYILESVKVIKKSNDEKKLDSELKYLDFNIVPSKTTYTFFSDDKPTPTIKGGKFTPNNGKN